MIFIETLDRDLVNLDNITTIELRGIETGKWSVVAVASNGVDSLLYMAEEEKALKYMETIKQHLHHKGHTIINYDTLEKWSQKGSQVPRAFGLPTTLEELFEATFTVNPDRLDIFTTESEIVETFIAEGFGFRPRKDLMELKEIVIKLGGCFERRMVNGKKAFVYAGVQPRVEEV